MPNPLDLAIMTQRRSDALLLLNLNNKQMRRTDAAADIPFDQLLYRFLRRINGVLMGKTGIFPINGVLIGKR